MGGRLGGLGGEHTSMTDVVTGVAAVRSMESPVSMLASVLAAVSWGAEGRHKSMTVCVPCVSVASDGVA